MIDFALLIDSIPALFSGALLSLQVATFSASIGMTLGCFFGGVQVYGGKGARLTVTTCVTLLRGTPMLVQLFFVFYVLPQIGIPLTPFQASVVAIGCNSAAYVSQMVRGGLQAVPAGQLEAASLLGIPFHKQLLHIIAPQSLRVCWPSIGNEIVTLIKDSSLASIVGVVELSKQGGIIRSRTYDSFTVLLGVALIYLLMTITVQLVWDWMEKRNKPCYL